VDEVVSRLAAGMIVLVNWLHGLSIGETCHIVQLCITQKQILGYDRGRTVPCEKSHQSAKLQCPCATDPESKLPLATWSLLRSSLQALCNVKRLLRSRFHIDVSETMLGYAKFSDLLLGVGDPKKLTAGKLLWCVF